jgi:flagellar motor switch protein FliM
MSEELSQQEQENRRSELEAREREKVEHVTKRTRFRKEIRMLRLSQSIEEFYRSTSDLNQARHQAENFLKHRLRRLFADMPTEEATELRQQSAEIIDAIEEKILQERRDEIEEQRRRAAEVPGQRQETEEENGDFDLTEEEMEMGVQIGRVEMRVAGGYRRVPQKIMPDPDAPASFVLAARDPQTGKLVPQRRRGRKRQVEKGEDGVWSLVESDTRQNEESDMADILSQEKKELAHASDEPASGGAKKMRKKMRVLVVEDSAAARRINVEVMKRLGFGQVEEVGNGEEALKLLSGRKKYHLVCTDWDMPVMDGIEMIAAIRGHAKIGELPVIMVTTRSTDRDVAQALRAGVSDYLVKPFKPDALGKKIEKVLSSGRVRMSEIYGTEDSAVLVKKAGDVLPQEAIDALLTASEGESQPMTQEEINAELEAAGVSPAVQVPVSHAAPDGRIVTSYDFKHPARVNKEQLRTLENLHDNFARLLSSTFSGAMRAVVDVDTAFVDQTTYAEFIMSLSNPSCSYQFTLGETGGQAVIDIGMPVVFAFVDRIFGGKGSSQGVNARVVTPVEIGVINRIIKRVIEDVEATWEPILPVEITDIELETNPEFMKITAASEIVILLAFEVNSTNASGLVNLCYPFFTLEPIMPLLGQQTYGRGHERSLPKRRERLGDLPLDVLGPAPIPLNVEMGQARLSLSEASALKVGDVVKMDSRTSDPCVMYVGDKPKYYVQPFAEDGKMHAEITGLFPRELYNERGIS